MKKESDSFAGETKKLKKKSAWLIAIGLAVFFASQSMVSAVDPPHNDAGGVDCSDCHGMSIIQGSPFWTTNTSDEAYNSICSRCHKVDNVPPFHATNAPQASSHTPGGSIVRCATCHHNHDQDQIFLGKNYKSQFFIATVTGISAIPNGDNTTDIIYNPGTWSGNGVWADPSMVDEKTGTGRGAQLVPDRNSRKRWPIYIITNVNTATNTITVKGNVTTAPNIGMFYGQLVRRSINARTVRFWNNSGANSFIDNLGNGVCQVCHTTTDYFRNDGTLANHNNGADCSNCHSHNNATTGGFAPSGPDHETDGLVTRDAGCGACHAGDVISGTDMHEGDCALCHQDPGGGNYILIDQATSTRVDAMPDGGSPAGTDGGGTCIECHGFHDADWYFHEVDHVVKGWVTPNTDTSSNTVNCVTCHSASGILTGVHDQVTQDGTRALICQRCHLDADKSLHGSASGYGEQDVGFGDPNQCNICHDGHFEDHNHHDSAENDVTYEIAGLDGLFGNATDDADNDTSQSTETGCAECHDDLSPGDNNILNSWPGIAFEHDVNDATQDGTGACVNCHDYDDSASAPLAAVTAAITSGDPASCATCHTDKVPDVDHGGHPPGDFVATASCTTVCHTGDIVSVVHANNSCTNCHGSGYVRIEGSPVNGIDGDARLADVLTDPRTEATCLTCHPDAVLNQFSADWKYATIHHDGFVGYATDVPASCTLCHNSSGFDRDHTNTTSLATNCQDCHSTTPVGNNNNVSDSDPKKHDACTTCHFIDATLTGEYLAKLNDPSSLPLVDTMDNGGDVGGINGGGDCEACHETFLDYHQTVDHSSMVQTYVNCSTCHSATGSTTGPSDPKVHDACSTCHNAANGRLSGSATTHNGAGDGGNDGGGNCSVCHNEYFDSHSNIDHSATVALDTNNASSTVDCFDCHSGTEGTATTVPTDSGSDRAANMKHDSCSTCHTTTGILTGTSAIATAMPNGVGGDGGKDGGSVVAPNGCQSCHGDYFDNHVHGADTAGYVTHSLSHVAGTDISQDGTAGNACYNCHDDSGLGKGTSALGTWVSIKTEHTTVAGGAANPCSICHDYVANGNQSGDADTPLLATVQAQVPGSSKTCISCHVPKSFALAPTTSSHGGHEDPDAFITWTGAATCRTCHDQDASITDMMAFHGVTGSGAAPNGCGKCHDSTSGGGELIAVLEGDATAKDGGGCKDCHNSSLSLPNFGTVHGETAATVGSVHNLSSDSSGGYDCEACHTFADGEAQLLAHMNDTDAVANCSNCHTAAGGATGVVNTAVGQHGATPFSWDADTANSAVNCEACHDAKGDYNLHGLTDDTGADGVVTEHNNLSVSTNDAAGDETDCAECHNLTDATSRLQMHTQPLSGDSNDCLTCHGASAGVTAATAVNGGKASATTPTAQTCEACHAAKGDYTRHGLTDDAGSDGVGDEHDQITATITSADSTCGSCHATSTALSGLRLHTQAATTCIECHNAAAPVSTVIAAGWAATPNAAQCEECHTDIRDSWDNHTVDHAASRVLPDTNNCTICHDGDPGSNTTAPNSVTSPYVGSGENHNPNACYTCHANSTILTRGGIKTPGAYTTTITAGDCDTCHTAYFGDNTGGHTHTHAIRNTVDNTCDDCHDAAGVGAARPANTAPFVATGDVHATSQCSTCHDLGTGLLTGSAKGATDGDSSTYLECDECHGAWTAVHTGASGVSHASHVTESTNCNTCHDNSAGPGDARLSVTTPFVDTGDVHDTNSCGTCHTTDGDIRSSGLVKAQTVTAGECQDCHTQNWDNIHDEAATTATTLTIKHAARVAADGDASCTACHTGTAGTNTNGTGLPLSSASTRAGNMVHDACLTCHTVAGGLTSTPTANGWASAVSTGTCDTCHGSTYFDSHVHGADTAGYVTHSLSHVAGTDISQDGTAGNACYNCHDDAGLGKGTSALGTWVSIKTEHTTVAGGAENPCSICHDYATNGNQSGAANTPLLATVEAQIPGSSKTCISCHVPKSFALAPSTSSHGNHEDPDTYITWTGAATCRTCHDQDASITDMMAFHGVTGSGTAPDGCGKCHVSTSGGGELIAVLEGDATAKDGGGCKDCHNSSLSLPTFGTVHGETAALVGSVHNLSSDSSGGYDCQACHTFADGEAQLLGHMGTDVVANCSNCHTAAGVATGVVDTAVGQHAAAPFSWDANTANTAVNCEDCHTAKGEYRLHGLTDNTGADGVATEHNNLSVSTNDAAGDETDCAECHNLTDATSRLQMHTQPLSGDSNDCLTCHGASAGVTAATAINGGKASATTPTAQTCEDCHAAKGDYTRHGLTDDNSGDGVVDVHDAFASQTGSATSACDDCHTGNPLDSDLKIMQVHTQASTTCLTCHDATATLTAAVISAGWGSADPAQCDECHTGIGADWYTHSYSHTLTATDCDTCHNADGSDGSNATNAISAPYVNAGEVHAVTSGGNGCAACHTTAGALKGSATGAVSGASCADCHIGGGDTWTTVHTAAIGTGAGFVDHSDVDTQVANHANCSGCHANVAGSAGRNAITTPYFDSTLVNGKTEVHAGSGCATCHDGGNDGGFNSPAAMPSVTVIASGTCITCHTVNWDTIHTSAATDAATLTISHVGEVDADGDASCTACHTDTAATNTDGTGLPINAGDTQVHDECLTCHTVAGGLTSTPTANGWASAVSAGTCDTCHGSGPDYFDSHVHGQDGGYVDHDVTFEEAGLDSNAGNTADNDTSYSDSQPCTNCHTPTGLLTTWTGINNEHDVATNGSGSCATCHESPRNSDVSSGYSDVADVIAAASAASCDTCHEDKTPNVDHGGHGGSFGSDTECTTCHDATMHGGTDVVNNIHSANGCDTCHSGSTYNAGTEKLGNSLTNSPKGDARLANNTAATSDWANVTCLTCHPDATYPGASVHHVSESNIVAGGDCAPCHTDPRTTPSGMSHSPYQLSCRACHIDVSGNTVTVKAISEGAAGSGGTGSQAGNTRATAANHTFTITAGTGVGKIQNYGECFHCHGVTGAAAGRGAPSQGSSTIVPYHAQKTNAQMGGSSTAAGNKLVFRGGSVFSWTDTTVGTDAFYGHGRGRINGNRAKFSLDEEYVKATFGSNIKGESQNYNITNAPNAFTYFEMVVNNLTLTTHIPVYDADYIAATQCSGSCDTVTLLNNNSNECRDHAGDEGTCIENRVLHIRATSSDSTAQMKFIHGNEITTMSCTSGTCVGSVDYSGFSNDYFDPGNPDNDTVCVISDKGGSDCDIITNTR